MDDATDTVFLFVYGTLRKGYRLTLMDDLADALSFIGPAKTNGVLYDLGAYPAILPDAVTEVRGELYEVKDPEAVFTVLDEYEGEEYQREKAAVSKEDGTVEQAWIYVFKASVREEHRIMENDYLEYLKNKKDRF